MGSYCVYMHTNSINNKKYIGITSSKNANRRWRNGSGYVNNSYFYKAISKHGWESFRHEILASDLSKEKAEQLEAELIEIHKTCTPENGYNIKPGGDSSRCSEATKEKIGAKNKGKLAGKNNPLFGLKGSNHPSFGIKRSDETRQRLRESRTGSEHSQETKAKISKSRSGKCSGADHPMYGKKHAHQTRAKISASRQGKLIGSDHPRAKAIIQSTLRGDMVMSFETAREAARVTGLDQAAITRACQGKLKQTGGYKWKYAN